MGELRGEFHAIKNQLVVPKISSEFSWISMNTGAIPETGIYCHNTAIYRSYPEED